MSTRDELLARHEGFHTCSSEKVHADLRAALATPPEPLDVERRWDAIVARLTEDRGIEATATPPAPPPHTRLILASENLLDIWGTRTERGERITVEWGEQKPEGWYEPVFTVHSDDVLATHPRGA